MNKIIFILMMSSLIVFLGSCKKDICDGAMLEARIIFNNNDSIGFYLFKLDFSKPEDCDLINLDEITVLVDNKQLDIYSIDTIFGYKDSLELIWSYSNGKTHKATIRTPYVEIDSVFNDSISSNSVNTISFSYSPIEADVIDFVSLVTDSNGNVVTDNYYYSFTSNNLINPFSYSFDNSDDALINGMNAQLYAYRYYNSHVFFDGRESLLLYTYIYNSNKINRIIK